MGAGLLVVGGGVGEGGTLVGTGRIDGSPLRGGGGPD